MTDKIFHLSEKVILRALARLASEPGDYFEHFPDGIFSIEIAEASAARLCEIIRQEQERDYCDHIDIVRQAKEPDLLLLIITLCDAMKRLERAISCNALEDRRNYLDEAAKRRRYVEDKILNIKPQN